MSAVKRHTLALEWLPTVATEQASSMADATLRTMEAQPMMAKRTECGGFSFSCSRSASALEPNSSTTKTKVGRIPIPLMQVTDVFFLADILGHNVFVVAFSFKIITHTPVQNKKT